MTRVLQILSWPTARPRHGGQVRAYHTRRILERVGIDVQPFEVFRASSHPDNKPAFNIDPAKSIKPYSDYWQLTDFAAGVALAADGRRLESFKESIDSSYCDLIMLEEPWLWPALRRMRLRKPIIYNAYNVEVSYKKAMFSGVSSSTVSQLISEIGELERSVSAAASGCSAVTEADAEIMRTWTRSPVVVAANGAVKRRLEPLASILPANLTPQERFVFYVSSANPPNINGFLDLVLPVLDSLRSWERIVVAGSICDFLETSLRKAPAHYMCRDRVLLMGEVTEFTLSCLIANSSGIILPISYGGGSNLKTAEALVSCKPVVATRAALRGYERFLDYPSVILADSPAEFASGIRRVFDSPPGSGDWSPEFDSLLWEQTLSPLADLVKQIASQQAN